jgi:GNAT superfamily N-acetyltransferase
VKRIGRPNELHIQIRLAQAEDAEKIVSVINSAFRVAEGFFVDGNRIDLKSVLTSLEKGNFLLAETDDGLLGCVYVEQRPTAERRAYFGLLSVDPTRQKSGVGTLLMDAAEDYGRRLGCEFMDIRVVNLRRELPAFYEKHGYRITGTSPFPAEVETKIPCHFIEMSKPLAKAAEVLEI